MSDPKLGSSPSQKSWLEPDRPEEDWLEAGCDAPGPVAAGAAPEPELVCCATAASAKPADKSTVMSMGFFISSSFPSDRETRQRLKTFSMATPL